MSTVTFNESEVTQIPTEAVSLMREGVAGLVKRAEEIGQKLSKGFRGAPYFEMTDDLKTVASGLETLKLTLEQLDKAASEQREDPETLRTACATLAKVDSDVPKPETIHQAVVALDRAVSELMKDRAEVARLAKQALGQVERAVLKKKECPRCEGEGMMNGEECPECVGTGVMSKK